jgi:hypothetical protein
LVFSKKSSVQPESLGETIGATYYVLNGFSLIGTQSKRELLGFQVPLICQRNICSSIQSRMSVLTIVAPCPTFIAVFANFVVELIYNLSTPKGSTASLNENPFGADKL